MNSPILALDIGFKRTGVALSESGLIAQPLKVLEAKPPHLTNVVQDVIGLVKEYEIQTLVVGLPFGENEEITGQALKTEQVVEQLARALQEQVTWPVSIERRNEFHSSLDADQLFPNVARDAAAAAIILQDFLDQNQSNPESHV